MHIGADKRNNFVQYRRYVYSSSGKWLLANMIDHQGLGILQGRSKNSE